MRKGLNYCGSVLFSVTFVGEIYTYVCGRPTVTRMLIDKGNMHYSFFVGIGDYCAVLIDNKGFERVEETLNLCR